MNMSALRKADLPLDGEFLSHSTQTLYLTYGSSKTGTAAYYVGITKRSLKKRTWEHIHGTKDRHFRFNAEGNLAWQLPSHWATGQTYGETSLIENLLLQAMNQGISSADWLDNMRYRHTVEGMTDGRFREVRDLLLGSVFEDISSKFGLQLSLGDSPIRGELGPVERRAAYGLSHIAERRARTTGWI
jgi:predicted GIY-YIG superfamily endonuclease